MTTDYSAESSLLNSSVQSRYVDMKPAFRDDLPNKLQAEYNLRIQKAKPKPVKTPSSVCSPRHAKQPTNQNNLPTEESI